MGGSLSEHEKEALEADYCGKASVDRTKTDVLWNPDAIAAGHLLDREDPNVKSIYASFQ